MFDDEFMKEMKEFENDPHVSKSFSLLKDSIKEAKREKTNNAKRYERKQLVNDRHKLYGTISTQEYEKSLLEQFLLSFKDKLSASTKDELYEMQKSLKDSIDSLEKELTKMNERIDELTKMEMKKQKTIDTPYGRFTYSLFSNF